MIFNRFATEFLMIHRGSVSPGVRLPDGSLQEEASGPGAINQWNR